MKIGFIYTRFYPITSSASVHGYQLVKGFKANGHEVHTIGIGKNEYTIDHPKSVLGLFKFIFAIDILYIRINPWLVNDWFTIIKILTLGRVKVVWEINAPVEEIYSNYGEVIPKGIINWVNRQNLKRKILAKLCDCSISVSDVLMRYSTDVLKIKESHYVSNGSDIELFKPIDKNANNPLTTLLNNKFVVVWAGNADTKWQGLNLIYDAAKYFNDTDKDVYFLIISNVSAYNKIILPNILSISEVNYFRLNEFLTLGDAALCLYENFSWSKYGFYNSPLKLYDYMSAGLPVISSNFGQLAEVIEHKRNGYLIDNSLKQLTETIEFIKANKSEGAQLGRSAREDITTQYNWSNSVRKILAFMQEIKTNKT